MENLKYLNRWKIISKVVEIIGAISFFIGLFLLFGVIGAQDYAVEIGTTVPFNWTLCIIGVILMVSAVVEFYFSDRCNSWIHIEKQRIVYLASKKKENI